ncbi:MAG: hypothetical protein AB1505_14935 [Candidatus Latescibacterota bacterium]
MTEWLAGTGAGAYRGRLGGTWGPVGGYGYRVTSLLQHRGHTFCGAGCGVWMVDLDGGRWEQLHDETLTEVLDLAPLPGDPGLLAASAYGVATPARDALGAARWTFWSDGLGVNERYSNAALVADDGRWLVGTEAGVLVAEEGGRRWSRTSLTGRAVRALCRALGSWWAGSDAGGIWRSADGLRWDPAGQGAEQATVFALSAAGDRLLAGTLEGVLAGDGAGPWQRSGPRLLAAAVVSDPLDPRVWLAGGVPGGVWYTLDAGARWQQVAGLPSVAEALTALAPRGQSPGVA